MGRGGATKIRDTGPERKCIATGAVHPKSALIRFVAGPDGQIVPDIMRKLPGRGVYVLAARAELERAAQKRLFARSLKRPIDVPEDLVEVIEAQLARRVVDLIAMARKSGQAVAGYEKVKDMLGREQARVLIQASDGSARGKSKLSTPHYGNYISCLTTDELGVAFGRQTVIHAALTSGGLAERIVEEAHRLNGVRAMTGATALKKD